MRTLGKKAVAIILGTSAAFSITAVAADIELGSRAHRHAYIQRATVWQTPPPDLSASDVRNGPATFKDNRLLDSDKVYCVTLPEDLEDLGGKSPKFECQLMKPLGGRKFEYQLKKNGSRKTIKVKYSPPGKDNSEIPGEIIGTRLLWALGFYADKMFFVDEVTCFGCTADPFGDKKVFPPDSGVMNVFKNTAIEQKLPGDEVVSIRSGRRREGVTFNEMMTHLPEADRENQKAQRDALRLLAIFMQHADLKSDNQRMACVNKNSAGECVRTIMMIHDIGTSFGVSVTESISYKKVNLRAWQRAQIWKDPTNCVAQMSLNLPVGIATTVMDATMLTPKISEPGRKFLADLLEEFIKDRRRVAALFEAARIDAREIPVWVDTFIAKVNQIRYPIGPAHPNFRCQ